jgi:hypothetical protein
VASWHVNENRTKRRDSTWRSGEQLRSANITRDQREARLEFRNSYQRYGVQDSESTGYIEQKKAVTWKPVVSQRFRACDSESAVDEMITHPYHLTPANA